MAYGFYFDSTRCTGCRTCEMACKDYHDLSTEAAFRRVFDYEGGEFVENAVDSPDEGVVGVPGQLLFDQPLSGAPHHARVVDHPGVPL